MLRRNSSLEYLDPPLSSSSRRSTLSSSIFSLVSTIIGGGVLSLPFAFAQCGLIAGLLFLALTAAASDFSIYVLISSSRRHRCALTYAEVMVAAFGPRMRAVTLALLSLLVFVAVIAYLMLIRDLTPQVVLVVTGVRLTERQGRAAYLLLLLLLTPLCCQRSLYALRYASVLSVLSVLVLAAAIVHLCISLPAAAIASAPLSSFLLPPSLSSLLSSSPIMINTFLCHFNVLPVHSSLSNPTRRRIHRLVHAVILLSLAVYAVVGIGGVLLVGQDVDGNVLNSIGKGGEGRESLGVVLGRVGLLCSLCCNFPLLVLPCRAACMGLLGLCEAGEEEEQRRKDAERAEEEELRQSGAGGDDDDDDADLPAEEEEEQSGLLLYPAIPITYSYSATSAASTPTASNTGSPFFSSASPAVAASVSALPSILLPTLAIVSSAFTLSLLISSVATLWSVLGSSVSILVAFILPAAAYIRIRRRKGWTLLRVSCCIMLGVSAVVMIVMTASVARRIVT